MASETSTAAILTDSSDESFCSENLWSTPINSISVYESHLKDQQRVLSFWNGITNQPHLFEGKLVLDISQNSGLYSTMAIRAGAERCFVVEYSAEEAGHTQRIMNVNGYDVHCEVHVGSMNDIEGWDIPEVDVIIHESMGDFLYVSSTIRQAIMVRDKFLKPTGVMLPNEASLYLAGINDESFKNYCVDFWLQPVCGIDMSCFKEMAMGEPEMTFVDPETVMTHGSFVHRLNFNSLALSDIGNPISSPFFFKPKFPDVDITGIVGYMNVDFMNYDYNTSKGGFSTSPCAPYTGWQQCVFPIDEVRRLDGTQRLKSHFSLTVSNPEGLNGIEIKINLCGLMKSPNGVTYTFYEPKKR